MLGLDQSDYQCIQYKATGRNPKAGIYETIVRLKNCESNMIFIVVLFSSLFSAVTHAEVSSLSDAVFEQRKDEAYWLVDFSCAGSDNKIAMQQEMLGDTWCLVNVENVCAETKQDLAAQACDSEFIQASANGVLNNEEPVSAQESIRSNEQSSEAQRAQEQARVKAAAEAKVAQLRAQQRGVESELIQLEREKFGLNQEGSELDAQAINLQDQLDSIRN